MNDILNTVESELRKRALTKFSRDVDNYLNPLRNCVSYNSCNLLHRMPDDISQSINSLRDMIVRRLGNQVQDDAVRSASELLIRVMSGNE